MDNHGLKNIIRGIVFVFYFPFHLLYVSLKWCYQNVIQRPLVWLWAHCLGPALAWIYRYLIIIPLKWIVQYVLKPIGNILYTIWKYLTDQLLKPFFKHVVWPIIYYIVIVPINFIISLLWGLIYILWNYLIYIPIRWLWLHVIVPFWEQVGVPLARWFWEEIFMVVLKWANYVRKWILRVLELLIWKPLKWLWGIIYPVLKWIIVNFIVEPLRWVIKQTVKLFRWIVAQMVTLWRWVKTEFIKPTIQLIRSLFIPVDRQ